MSRPDSKQMVILKRLTAQIEGVSQANGDDFDLKGRVYRGKANFGSTETLPFIAILESLRPDANPDEGGTNRMHREERWELLVQGWADTSDENPTDNLYALKAAVEARIARVLLTDNRGSPVYPDEYLLGRSVIEIRIGPGIVRAATPQAGGAEAFYLPLIVRYAINLADPWAL